MPKVVYRCNLGVQRPRQTVSVRTVFLATGRPAGISSARNHTNRASHAACGPGTGHAMRVTVQLQTPALWHPWAAHFAASTRRYPDGVLEYALVDVVAAAFAPYGEYSKLSVIELPMVDGGPDGLGTPEERARLEPALAALSAAMRGVRGIPVAELHRSASAAVLVYMREGSLGDGDVLSIAAKVTAPYVPRLRAFRDPLWTQYQRALDEPEYVDALANDALRLVSTGRSGTAPITPTFELSFASPASARAAAVDLDHLGYDPDSRVEHGGFGVRFGRTITTDIEALAPLLYLARTLAKQYGGTVAVSY